MSIGNGIAVETIVDDVPKIAIPDYFQMTNRIVSDIFSNYAEERLLNEQNATSKVILCSTNELLTAK